MNTERPLRAWISPGSFYLNESRCFMPVSETTQNLYLQLGIAGAALLILLVAIILIFKSVGKLNPGNTVERLCDKIDALITSNANYTEKLNEVLLSNDKDQKETLRLLKSLIEITSDTQRRVVRIDDRTYRCRGNIKNPDDKE